MLIRQDYFCQKTPFLGSKFFEKVNFLKKKKKLSFFHIMLIRVPCIYKLIYSVYLILLTCLSAAVLQQTLAK